MSSDGLNYRTESATSSVWLEYTSVIPAGVEHVAVAVYRVDDVREPPATHTHTHTHNLLTYLPLNRRSHRLVSTELGSGPRVSMHVSRDEMSSRLTNDDQDKDAQHDWQVDRLILQQLKPRVV